MIRAVSAQIQSVPMPVEAPEIIEVDATRVACDGDRRRAGPSARLSGNGRRDFRGMPLLRPPLCAARPAPGPASLSALKKGDHLYLIDGSGYLFRAYHALPPLTRKSDGLPIGAVSGYCNMLWKLLEDMKGGDAPTHLAVIFDAGEKTFRNEIYKEYKAQPPAAARRPDPAISPGARCHPRLRRLLRRDERAIEADDLIATYARLAREAGARCTIVSSDKDLMQLVVDGKVELLDTMKNKRIASAEVMEKFGVAARQGGRGAGAGRRFHRQCAGRARHRRQDRGRTDQPVWRSRNAAEARRRDQAEQAPRDPDRECRQCAHLAASW